MIKGEYNPNMEEDLKKRIEVIRKIRGISQYKMCGIAGINQGVYTNWHKPNASIMITTLTKLMKALQVTWRHLETDDIFIDQSLIDELESPLEDKEVRRILLDYYNSF